ncbi:MAG TPA: hypothetical protein VE153_03975 [Myxococcus sp.]|jgi:hypothetical protein|nr:hypothetical protein [Myxococcus sp.]
MFSCGNDEAAKQTAAGICKDFGWPTIDMGDIENARYLEPLAMVWSRHFFRIRTGNHAFKLLKVNPDSPFAGTSTPRASRVVAADIQCPQGAGHVAP